MAANPNINDEIKMMRDFLSEIVRDMRKTMSSGGAPPFKNMNASGESRKEITFSIETTPDAIIGKIFGPKHIIQLERGRKKGKFPPIASIRAWMNDKGIIPREGDTEANKKSLAFLIARKISQDGTRMNAMKHQSGIITDNITKERVEDFFIGFYKNEELKIRTKLAASLEELGKI